MVKRYKTDDDGTLLDEIDDGSYVDYSDYQKLETENTHLAEMLNDEVYIKLSTHREEVSEITERLQNCYTAIEEMKCCCNCNEEISKQVDRGLKKSANLRMALRYNQLQVTVSPIVFYFESHRFTTSDTTLDTTYKSQ